jgi:hypothetical protein
MGKLAKWSGIAGFLAPKSTYVDEKGKPRKPTAEESVNAAVFGGSITGALTAASPILGSLFGLAGYLYDTGGPEDSKFQNEKTQLMNDQATVNNNGGATQHNNQRIEVYVNQSNASPEQIGDGVNDGVRRANNDAARDLRGAHR